MSDNLRRYRAIHQALKQGYPGEPSGRLAQHLTTLAALAVYLPTADKYPRLTRLPLTGAKRHSLEGSHCLSAAHSPLVTPSMQAMRTHVACSGHLPWPLPITLLAHTPAGCGHGGTRKSKTSRKLQT